METSSYFHGSNSTAMEASTNFHGKSKFASMEVNFGSKLSFRRSKLSYMEMEFNSTNFHGGRSTSMEVNSTNFHGKFHGSFHQFPWKQIYFLLAMGSSSIVASFSIFIYFHESFHLLSSTSMKTSTNFHGGWKVGQLACK